MHNLKTRIIASAIILLGLLFPAVSFGYFTEASLVPGLTLISDHPMDDYAISEDGQWAVIGAMHTDQLYLVKTDRSEETTVTLTNNITFYGDGAGLAFSSDNEWIFFVGFNNENSSQQGLWKIRVNGTQQMMLFNKTRYFTLSPDGLHIAQITDDSGFRNITITDADGTNPQDVFTFPYESSIQFPDWSPDGNKIAFHAWGDDGCDLWVVDSDGNNLQAITNTSSQGITSYYPRWSPDGSRLTYWSGNDPGDGLWSIQSDGSNKFPILPGRYSHSSYFTSGDRIAFRNYYPGYQGLYFMHVPDPITLLDVDTDHISNFDEYYFYGTDCSNADSDYDSLGDGIEIRIGLDPTTWDSNGDGLGDMLEFLDNFGVGTEIYILPQNFTKISYGWSTHDLNVTTNSTMLNMHFNSESGYLNFEANGPTGSVASCNVSIPTEIIPSIYELNVTVDGTPIGYSQTSENELTYLRFEYTHSAHIVSIYIGSQSETESTTTTTPPATSITTTTTNSDSAANGTDFIATLSLGAGIGGAIVIIIVIIFLKRTS